MSSPERLQLLGRWYADPLDRDAAQALLSQARIRRQRLAAHGRDCRICWLLDMIGHHWLGEDIGTRHLLARQALVRSAHGRALVALIYGQLLASRRLPGACTHLAEGFRQARGLLAPSDYFVLLHRHQLLQRLPPAARPIPPAGLQELLAAARVIERLEQTLPRRPLPPHDPSDLYG